MNDRPSVLVTLDSVLMAPETVATRPYCRQLVSASMWKQACEPLERPTMAQGREPQASPARSVQPRGDTHAEASREDAYKSPKHIAEPSTCPECGAFYHAGRWTWKNPGPGHAAQVVCPACARIRDNFPAGELELSGDFVAAHRDEIDGLIHNVAETENGEHPLHRVMSIAEQGGGLLISTTDIHLPRRIGQALHDAYGGEFDFQYATGDQHIRAVWTRS